VRNKGARVVTGSGNVKGPRRNPVNYAHWTVEKMKEVHPKTHPDSGEEF